MTHDRVEGDSFSLTHEFLAFMLGVRRAGVTVAAGILQKAGLITYKRGNIQILDRRGLESAACDCYGIVNREFANLLDASFLGRS
jgi:cAMP-binding proteins - catabolite gene activator and regulatory subunit of cAMP-dependent protein kinases